MWNGSSLDTHEDQRGRSYGTNPDQPSLFKYSIKSCTPRHHAKSSGSRLTLRLTHAGDQRIKRIALVDHLVGWLLTIMGLSLTVLPSCSNTSVATLEPKDQSISQPGGVEVSTSTHEASTELFFEGNDQEFTSIDAGIAFALAQGMTDPTQMAAFVERIVPDVILSDNDIMGSGWDPMLLSDFDGDSTVGTVQDAAVALAIATNIRDHAEIETFCLQDLQLPDGCPLASEAVIPPALPTPDPTSSPHPSPTPPILGTAYYVDAETGNDQNRGTSPDQAWKTLAPVNKPWLYGYSIEPGDVFHFKRGSVWVDSGIDDRIGIIIETSGTETAPIIYRAYGDPNDPPPVIEAPSRSWGGGINVYDDTDWIVIEDFLIQNAAETGIHINRGSNHILINNVEITDTGHGVTLRGGHNRVIHSYIHDLKMVNNDPIPGNDYGAAGIQLESSHNEIAYNRFVRCKAESYDYVFDGGVIEFFGPEVHNNMIHHNYAEETDGFFEMGFDSQVTMRDNVIAYNVAYNTTGAFAFIHLDGVFAIVPENLKIENNTVVSDANDEFGGETLWNLIFFEENTLLDPSAIQVRNNIFWITDTRSFFRENSGDDFIHEHNLYLRSKGNTDYYNYNIDLHPSELNGDPRFVGFDQQDFRLQADSPAIDAGALLGYSADFEGNPVPQGNDPDIGAYEFIQ